MIFRDKDTASLNMNEELRKILRLKEQALQFRKDRLTFETFCQSVDVVITIMDDFKEAYWRPVKILDKDIKDIKKKLVIK